LSDILTSQRITREDAALIQKQMTAGSDLLVWVITDNPRDLPGRFVARPYSAKNAGSLPVHLEAPSLDEIRELLPAGLVRIGRAKVDDPVVVETWL
jgi:hypothetical protein